MPDLSDRTVWDALKGPLETAQTVLLDRAARAETADHPYARGKLEGLEHALVLLKKARTDIVRASGDVIPD